MINNSVKSDSILKKRIRRFKSIKRGYYSFIIVISLYLISFLLPIMVNSKALVVCYANNEYDEGEPFIDEGEPAGLLAQASLVPGSRVIFKDSEWFYELSPRVGFSHVITDKATFTFNYGVYHQTPVYERIYLNTFHK